MRCSVCRLSCRKTTTIYVPRAEGLVRRRVCATCMRHTVTIYVLPPPLPCSGGCDAQPVMCLACANRLQAIDATALLRKILQRLRGLSRAHARGDDNLGAAYTLAADQIEAELRQLKGPSS